MAGAERAFSAAGNRRAFSVCKTNSAHYAPQGPSACALPYPLLPAERFSCGLCVVLLPVLGAVVVPHFLINRFLRPLRLL